MLLLTLLSLVSYAYGHYRFDSSTQLQQREVEVKWNHFGKIRRFTIASENCCMYDELMKTLRTYEPTFHGALSWKDSENDSILLNSANELNLALKHKSNAFLRLNTIDETALTYQTAVQHNPQVEVFRGRLLDIEDGAVTDAASGNLSLAEKELKLLRKLVTEQTVCPIIIVPTAKPEIATLTNEPTMRKSTNNSNDDKAVIAAAAMR
ncbi:unnamed protein product [Litomosoides sigmodontis]|uniref:Uncharacterized protein n=1 Tax=Litomosoides sigmodontis TaxID=42156 RepID=A0A3P6USW6_LITSI|nr:unnamed protein product [Litomosoides sigmodontis]